MESIPGHPDSQKVLDETGVNTAIGYARAHILLAQSADPTTADKHLINAITLLTEVIQHNVDCLDKARLLK